MTPFHEDIRAVHASSDHGTHTATLWNHSVPSHADYFTVTKSMENMADDNYVVNINALLPRSLSGPASPSFPLPMQTPPVGLHTSRTFPISTVSPEIRLLDLQASEHSDDPLVGAFRRASLDQENPPHYTALSYVWGTAEPTQEAKIDVGVGFIHITRNCEEALRQIRSLHGNVTIWVDSICIDQTSEAERHHQVSLMGDVYSNASTVYIWLGQETPGLTRALEYLRFAATFMYFPVDHVATGSAYQRLKFLCKVLPPIVTLKLMRNKWKLSELRRSYPLAALEELLETAWFSRIWTFQEIVLANNPVMLCGATALNWTVFVRGFRCLDFLLNNREGFWDSIDRVHKEKIFLCEDASGKTIGCQEDFWEGEFKAPRGFLALKRLFFLWMHVDRQGHRSKNSPVESVPDRRSTLSDQQSYIVMWHRHLRNLGLFSTHIAFFLLACCVIIGLVGFYPTGESAMANMPKIYAVVIGCLFGSPGVILVLQLVLYNPEGYSADLSTKEAEKQVKDQLVSSVVENLSYRKAKDPKDMSYALYGILRGFGVDLASLDYTKTQGCIFHELCLDMLKFQPSAINLLMYANKVDHQTGSLDTQADMSPTWVPDWSKLRAKQFDYLKPSSIPEFYCATEKGFPAATRFSTDHKAILVSGHWKGTVAFCMGSLDTSLDEVPRSLARDDAAYASIKLFSDWIKALMKFVFTKYRVIRRGPTCEGTCCAGADKRDCRCTWRDEAEHPATAIYTFLIRRKSRMKATDCDLLRFRKIYDIFAQEHRGEKVRPPEMTPEAAQDILDLLYEGDLVRFFVEVIDVLGDKHSRWFITSDGYLGCGTDSVMPGDRLALVAGVAVPMALRPMDSTKSDWFDAQYMAVCSTYVLGWMYGEAFERGKVRTIHVI